MKPDFQYFNCGRHMSRPVSFVLVLLLTGLLIGTQPFGWEKEAWAFSGGASGNGFAVSAATDSALSFELEFYRYNENAVSGTPQERWGAPLDLSQDHLSGGQKLVAAVKYRNLSSLSSQGIAGAGVHLQYDLRYVKPLFAAQTPSDAAVTVSGLSTECVLLNQQLIAGGESWPPAYDFDGVDQPESMILRPAERAESSEGVLEAPPQYRAVYLRYGVTDLPDADQAIGAGTDAGYVAFFPFEVKPVITTQAAFFALLNDELAAVDVFTQTSGGKASGIRALNGTEVTAESEEAVVTSSVVLVEGGEGSIEGRVQTESLAGNHTAEISAYWRGENAIDWNRWNQESYRSQFAPTATASALSSGAFTLAVPAGTYDLLITKPGYLDYVMTGVPVTEGIVTTVKGGAAE